MRKAELMDRYLEACETEISSSEVCKVVKLVFGLNLDTIPFLGETERPEDGAVPRMMIDSYLKRAKEEITGAYIRRMINGIFGVNLDALSSLEGARISLYSKDQWMLRQDRDLFMIHTGTGDVDALVSPTNYFTEQTSLTQLPVDLQESLTNLGYHFDDKMGGFYFSNQSGEAVPDAFKGQTIRAIMEVIQKSYSNI